MKQVTMKNKEKAAEEFMKEHLKQKIEMKKTELDRYVQTIKRSAFIECCTGGAYFNDLFHTAMMHGHDILSDSNITKKERDLLRKEWFPIFKTGDTEIDILKANLDYQDSLISFAKFLLNDLDSKKKEEIIMDCLTQKHLWSDMMDRNYKLQKQIENKSKKKNGTKTKKRH